MTKVEELLKIPGVGPYTAGAIASIAHKTVAPVVDGNVVRVMSRLRRLGDDPKAKDSVKEHWRLMTELVDPKRPGDFNQSVMELGASLCSVQNPKCKECPIQKHCGAFKGNDMESFPLKVAKKKTPEEDRLVVIFERQDDDSASKSKSKKSKSVDLTKDTQVKCDADALKNKKVLIRKRPATGLLANQWEFPNMLLENSSSATAPALNKLCKTVNLSAPRAKKRFLLSEHIKHVFSQVVHNMRLIRVIVDGSCILPGSSGKSSSRSSIAKIARPSKKRKAAGDDDVDMEDFGNETEEVAEMKWVSASDLYEEFSTSGQKKIVDCYVKNLKEGAVSGRQTSLDAFFTKGATKKDVKKETKVVKKKKVA